MPLSVNASELLQRELLGVRSRLIDLAATLDRIDRAEGSLPDDSPLDTIRESLRVLASDRPDRAEQIQLLFSLPYREQWQQEYGY